MYFSSSPRYAMSNCKKCHQKVLRSTGATLSCVTCKEVFHSTCVGTSPKPGASFKCSFCESSTASLVAMNEEPILASLGNFLKDFKTFCETKFSDLEKNNSVSDLRSYCEGKFVNLDKVFEAMKNLAGENAELEERVKGLESENSELREISGHTEREMDKLDQRVEKLQHQANLSSIEIHGIPDSYQSGKNPVSTAISVLNGSLGMAIDKREILSCSKLQVGVSNNKKHLFLVNFTNRKMRSKAMLAKRENMRKDGKISVSFEGKEYPVFINERLTQAKGKLLKQARETAKMKNYKYIWVTNGVVKARKCYGDKIIYINSLKDLSKL